MIQLPSFAAVRLGALVAVIAGAGVAGWTVRGWKEDAARIDAERAARATYVATVDGWAAAMQEIHGQRAIDQQQAATDRHEFERRLKDATRGRIALATVECPVSSPIEGVGASGDGLSVPAGPVPPVVRFSPAFVRLWNDGLAIGLPAALRADRCDRAGAAADPARGD